MPESAMTYADAWQKLFEVLPPDQRLEILGNPKGPRAAEHAKDALLISEGQMTFQDAKTLRTRKG